MSKRREPPPPTTPAPGFGTLGDVLARGGVRTRAATPEPPPEPSTAVPRDAEAPDLSGCGKIAVRRERKGHGGKTATIVTGLGLATRDLERLAKALRRALGCGASVDGDRLVVQGDQALRVQAWLAAQGARRIVVGN
jgi:translation initiation factor 1